MEFLYSLPIDQIQSIIFQIFKIIGFFWWLWLPFFLLPRFKKYYLYFIQFRWDRAKIKRIVLEIKIPAEVAKPIRAMETVFNGFWQIHMPPNPREKWLDGEFQLSISLEIASIDGVPHFFIRTPVNLRGVIESHIYSQYSEAEIFEVEDYAKQVPQDIPNKDWDLWGTGYRTTKKESCYPIRTYAEFETERELEEKRIDPMSSLLEGMSTLKPGEQLWVQIGISPVLDEDFPWITEGRKIRDKLVRRVEKPKPKPIWQETAQILITGKPTEVKEEKEIIPPEMKLSPGEREIVAGVEKKISKLGFRTFVRYIYLGKREVFFKRNTRLAMSYFTNFVTQNLSGLVPDSKTLTKMKTIKSWFLDKRRLYIRQRRLFRYYVMRLPPFFPQPGGTFILNTEELATIFHFPGRTVAPAPTVPRVEAKKGEPPSELPTE